MMSRIPSKARACVSLDTNDMALKIVADVCKRFPDVTRAKLFSHDRHWFIVWPRFIAIALIYESVPCYQADIAELFGVSPQAVCYALGAVRDMEDTSARARSEIEIMRMRLGVPSRYKPDAVTIDGLGRIRVGQGISYNAGGRLG